MFKFLDIAELFIATLQSIGDFLLLSPLGVFGEFLRPFENELQGLSPFLDFVISLNSISIAGIIFGTSLLGIIIIRLVKFIVDLVK